MTIGNLEHDAEDTTTYPEKVAEANELIETVKSQLSDILTGDLSPPCWRITEDPSDTPGVMDHLRSLRMKSATTTRSELETYKLGSFKEDPTIAARLNDIHKVGVNT